MDLKRVLFIEDKEDFAERVKEEFSSKNVEVIHIRDDSELENELSQHPNIQLVILDWLLDGDTSLIARLCLNKIRKICFVPIVVWTEELAIFEGEAEEVFRDFPQACLKSCSKSDVRFDQLLQFLSDWYSSPPMSFLEYFKTSIFMAVEMTFYKLAEHSSDDLVKGLKSLTSVGEGAIEIDIDHTIDVLMRLVERDVSLNYDFVANIKRIVRDLQLEDQTRGRREIPSKLQDLYMYYEPRDEDSIIRTGDIVEISYNNNQKNARAIVMTPACDLANPGKTMFLTLDLIHEARANDNQRLDRWSFNENGQALVVCHHEILVLKNNTLLANPANPSVMLYTHGFSTITDETIRLKRQKRLDDPYRSDLLHHFVSFAGRVGVPSFKLP